MDEELYELLQQADPDTLQRMIAAGLAPVRMQQAHGQLDRAQALTGTPMPEGQRVGSTYVAASPLEHLAAAFTRVRGQQGVNAAEQRLAGLTDQVGGGQDAFIQALIRQGQRRPAPAVVPPALVTGELES